MPKQGVSIDSIADDLKSSTSTGRALLQMLAIITQMEKEFISERTVAGLAAAKAQGRIGGRPKALDPKRTKQAQTLRDGEVHPMDIAKTLGVSVATVYRLTKSG